MSTLGGIPPVSVVDQDGAADQAAAEEIASWNKAGADDFAPRAKGLLWAKDDGVIHSVDVFDDSGVSTNCSQPPTLAGSDSQLVDGSQHDGETDADPLPPVRRRLEPVDTRGMRLEQSGSHLGDALEMAKKVTFGEDLDDPLGDVKPETNATHRDVYTPDDKISTAPFSKEGPLPNICKESSLKGPGSIVTDFGKSIYDEDRKLGNRSRADSLVPAAGDKRSFQDQLFSVLDQVHEEKKGFFPWSVLSAIVTQDRVLDVLLDSLGDSCEEDVIRKYAKKICEEEEMPPTASQDDRPRTKCFRKIFVILVLIDKTAAVGKFLDEDVSDADLPLVRIPRRNERGLFDLRLSRNPDRVLKCFRNKWNQLHIRNFEEWQWTTLAPYFGKGEHRDVLHYELANQVILPFTSDSRRDKASMERSLALEGGFGRVFQVDIHPDHHNFHDGERKSQSFAVKRLHLPDQKAFRREVEILKRFSNNRHPHLVSLLATYEQFNSYFLIFPWAESDLKRYWCTNNPAPKVDWATTLWAIEQCRGIVDGVANIHQFRSTNSKVRPVDVGDGDEKPVFGFHGDIKPENVLWFPEPGRAACPAGGTLKLSDFGLAELSIHQTLSKRPPSQFVASPSYRAPECDVDDEAKLGRATDMWALGCLYLEFLSWLLGGWPLVSEFRERRYSVDPMWCGVLTDTFFKLVKGSKPRKAKAVIKPAVSDFIEKLHSHESCSQFVHDFLDIIQKQVLVVITGVTDVNRFTSLQLDQELMKLLTLCKNIEDYACKPVPRTSFIQEPSENSRPRDGVDPTATPFAPSLKSEER